MNSTHPVQPNHSPSDWANRLTSLPIALRLLSGLGGLILFGALLFMLPGISNRPLSFTDALFTSASALTVTGLSVISPGRDLTFMGQLLLLVMIQVGGIGLMVFTVVIFRLLGRRISLVERIALRNVFGKVMPGAIFHLIFLVMAVVLILESAGAVLLWLQWRPYMEPGSAAWYAIFHSISAFCNSGFELFTGLPGFDAIPNDSGTLSILGGLIFIGSLGVPVVADLLALRRKYKLTLQTRLTLLMIVGMMFASTIVLIIGESIRPGVLAQEPWDRRIGISLFQSISARTAGFTPLEAFEAISPPAQLILMLVMFVGASPASMGGGITTGTAVVLITALWSYARNRPYPEVGGRTISNETIRRATAVLTISLIVVFMVTLLLLLTNPGLTLDGALFEVISAFATCGLTLAYTPRLTIFGQLLIIVVMIWGRLGALSIMVALTRPTQQPIYYYPEEQIMIG